MVMGYEGKAMRIEDPNRRPIEPLPNTWRRSMKGSIIVVIVNVIVVIVVVVVVFFTAPCSTHPLGKILLTNKQVAITN